MTKIQFDNSYIKLPDEFYQRANPTVVKAPELFKFNSALAQKLGFQNLETSEAAKYFSGNQLFDGSEPISMAYAGHQFGGFAPQLGDGRAVQLGEILDPNGVRYDIQLKGSGRTPWSRGGDGRSALGPVIREYLLSEAMAKLGVPTTRALAAVTTGEQVIRETLLPGAILTRVASGFVRVGTFEYFYRRDNQAAIKALADYEIERHYKTANEDNNPYVSFFKAVVDKQARLIAQWMHYGFIHGVMNTDNMSIAGETIDYGPCAFMDNFNNNQVYSSIDYAGRYSYSNQPRIGQWNLTRLAETLLFLFDENQDKAIEVAEDILNRYADRYQNYWLEGMSNKLGISKQVEDDRILITDLMALMDEYGADFTLTFYYLTELVSDFENSEVLTLLTGLFASKESTKTTGELNSWLLRWQQRLSLDVSEDTMKSTSQVLMRSANPIYIPRNHLVHAAISAAEEHNDFSVFNDLHEVLQNPFVYRGTRKEFMLPPKPDEVVHRTYCGT